MSYTYTYKYTIPNLKFLNMFHTFIETIPGLPTNFNLLSEDQVSITFNEELSSDQINTLSTFIQNYAPPQNFQTITSTNTLNILNTKINSTIYTTISTDIWVIDPDNDNDNDIRYLNIVSNLVGPLNSNANYSIRLYDALNNKIIFESPGMTNTTMQIFKIEDFINIPTTDSIIQLQGKVSNTNYSINIASARIVYYKITC